ncbi:MAG TPA: DinB family protein [Pseudonocardiaceae bacterium]
MESRDRPWPEPELGLRESVLEYFQFVHTTAVNKVAGLSEEAARATPLASSPVMSVLGLIKHLTAVQRQHVQLHVGGAELPQLWRHEDTTWDFRVAADETIDSVVAAFDAEWERSRATLAAADWDATVEVYGRPVRVGRLLVDVLQESARHLGHLDIVRELVDGATGE